jgi:hypothetical protein
MPPGTGLQDAARGLPAVHPRCVRGWRDPDRGTAMDGLRRMRRTQPPKKEE